MTAQIPLSQIGDAETFKQRVVAFRQARIDHQKTVDVPAPQEHHLVEAAVRRLSRYQETGSGDQADLLIPDTRYLMPDEYVIDYEIIDDRPSLRARKNALIAQISEQERALMEASMAPGRRRLAGLRAHEIRQKPEVERSGADKRFLAETQARLDREAATGRHAAEQMAAIEDLTDQTIGDWQPAPFPGRGDTTFSDKPRADGLAGGIGERVKQ
jgi:hypothetical protein